MRVLVTLAGWAKSESLNRGAPGRTNSPESALEVTGPRVSYRSGCSLHRTYIPTTGLPTGCIDSGHAEEAPLILGGFPFAISTMALTELVGIAWSSNIRGCTNTSTQLLKPKTTSWL